MGSIIAAALAATATVGSSVISSQAAGSASKTQAQAAQNAAQVQLQMFQQQEATLDPFVKSGVGALGYLNFLLGDAPSGTAVPTPGLSASEFAPLSTTPVDPSTGIGTPASTTGTLSPHSGTPLSPGDWGSLIGGENQPGAGGWSPSEIQALQQSAGYKAYLASFVPGYKPTVAAGGPGTPGGAGLPAGYLTRPFAQYQPFAPTLDQLQKTPGYQFTLDQGLKAAQNSYAGLGLAKSGAASKGAINYAEGLAGTTFQQQFQNYITNYMTGFSSDLASRQAIEGFLLPLVQSGQGAAANVGAGALTTGANVGSTIVGAGNALAAGQVGSANAIGAGLGNLGNIGLTTALLSQTPGLFGNQTNPLSFSQGPVSADQGNVQVLNQ